MPFEKNLPDRCKSIVGGKVGVYQMRLWSLNQASALRQADLELALEADNVRLRESGETAILRLA